MEKIVVNKQASIDRMNKTIAEIVATVKNKAEQGFESFRTTVKITPRTSELIEILRILEDKYSIKVCHRGISYIGETKDGFKQFSLHLFISFIY